MQDQKQEYIRIKGAKEHNLRNISLNIPHNKLIVVTGVSGSGKSSLAFDVIAREGQRRFLETFSSFSRQFMGKMNRPDVESIEGLSPVITISQKTVGNSSRSTVGTMSDLYDLLRLLYARIGEAPEGLKIRRSLFSFNTPEGACPLCKGLGLEEQISLDKLITDPEKSLRQGVLSPTLPTGYIMYSQVTMDVLDQVCRAHGFNVDIPWKDLSPEQQDVVLNGSTRIKVPFGKHPLESRLKWTGITAKPREEDYYKGMIPVMSDILRRDRNANILRYVESVRCSLCKGKRLNEKALSVRVHDTGIDQLSDKELTVLADWLKSQTWSASEAPVAIPISQKMLRQIELLEKLGLGHLSLSRPAGTLSGGESQRIRLVNQISAELSNVLYVFDEPSIGLHPSGRKALAVIMKTLIGNGNTVIVVEHDEDIIREAEWIIDIGPGAGEHGGELIFNGPLEDFLQNKSLESKSPTYHALHQSSRIILNNNQNLTEEYIELKSCYHHNLKNIDVKFSLKAFNIVTGVSGAGKASLVHGILEKAIQNQLTGTKSVKIEAGSISGIEKIDKLITIDQAPIGRTPRSNPATYTGLADRLRDLFAQMESAKTAGFNKSTFSFNTAGGRCENCQGAGSIQIGMHFLGNVDVICPVCNGKRFKEEILQIHYKDKNISEVLEMTVEEALSFFAGKTSILKYLQTLNDVGLGYIHLGQASSTLSGGEAQRIKLASELQQKDTGNTLYILDEPTTGLHIADIEVLTKALRNLVRNGNTIICIEHDTDLIRQADRVIDLGPGSGSSGGYLTGEGTPLEISKIANSETAKYLRGEEDSTGVPQSVQTDHNNIILNGVSTHLLKNINVIIPKHKLTVITGLSGSGKSSLAFDTLFAEAQSRFTESLSTYSRSLLKQSNPARMESCSGLGPVVAINRKSLSRSARSTVGTITGIYDHYRLLYSRISQTEGKDYTARHFSFNHESGACPVCDGLGIKIVCDPYKLISKPEKSIAEGAMDGHKTGKFYADPNGQYYAALKEVAHQLDLDIEKPWQELDQHTQKIALYGTGDKIWDFKWEYKNKTRSGEHAMQAPWPGFCNLINDEYQRRHLNKNIEDLEDLLQEKTCETCHGSRLKPELLEISCMGKNIAQLSDLSVDESLIFFNDRADISMSPEQKAIISEIRSGLMSLMNVIQELGLGYLSISRSSSSLSGGEGQRLRLAGALSSKLYGVTYVLDEPTIGLHSKNIIPLTRVLRKLIHNGNTAVVVEHDEIFIREADHIIEMGPGAGRQGGEVIFKGTIEDILNSESSPTGSFLRNPFYPQAEKRNFSPRSFGIRGASKHNLKHIDLDFISGGIIAITGISGSGKSTLVMDVLFRSAKTGQPIGCESTYGLDQFDRVISMDQQPLSSNSLSTPATLTGLMDLLRERFAASPCAKSHKLGKSAFSYIHKDGKCPDCNGYGQKKTSMDFMGDVWTICETCQGSRYKESSLECLLQGKNIAQVLNMTVDEALIFFEHDPKLNTYLKPLSDLGNGHLELGQAGDTLSGGEAQRLRLANEMILHRKGHNLYLFDEPTTGLHFRDILKLIKVFNELADEGHTLMFIEHNVLLTGIANQYFELGPGSGEKGGRLI